MEDVTCKELWIMLRQQWRLYQNNKVILDIVFSELCQWMVDSCSFWPAHLPASSPLCPVLFKIWTINANWASFALISLEISRTFMQLCLFFLHKVEKTCMFRNTVGYTDQGHCHVQQMMAHMEHKLLRKLLLTTERCDENHPEFSVNACREVIYITSPFLV